MRWTEALVLDTIRGSFLPPTSLLESEEWAMLTQVLLRAPKPHVEKPLAAAVADGGKARKISVWETEERTIDALLVRNWMGGRPGHERLAVEVKVSKADYRNETDEKRAPAWASAHRCAYAAPAGLIDPDTLPAGWGLIEVYGPDTPIVWCKRAERHEPTCDLNYLVSAGFRRASRAEEQIRRGDTPAAEVAKMRAEVKQMAGQLDRAQAAAAREMRRAKAARSELLGLEGAQECADCGEPVTWKRGGHHDTQWRHVDTTRDGPCMQARMEADRQRRMVDNGAYYSWGDPGYVEPVALRRAHSEQAGSAS